MHILIVGARRSGKSTLIAAVTGALGRPVYGFETVKEDDLASPEKGSPIYIYPAGGAHIQGEENLAGWCKAHRAVTNAAAFDRWAERIARPPQGHVVLLDEIGFMESASPRFCDAVMRLLDGDTPVIAAVKHNSTPFLDAVRAHPNCRCFYITPENRDALAQEAAAFAAAQLAAYDGRKETGR